jgi:lysophospholipase L1-like esterase
MRLAKTKIITILFALTIAFASFIIVVNVNSQKQIAAQIIRVACVGDSITEWSNYPQALQELLGDGYLVGNFGVAGSAVTKQSDLPYTNQSAFEEAIDFQPHVVVIMLGTNDAKEYNYRYIYNFIHDYQDIVTTYDALPDDQQIYLVTPPPIYENDLGLDNSKLEETIIPQIEQVADNMNLPTVDVNSALTDHSDYFDDGVHPNDEGSQVIANTINNAITQDFTMLDVYKQLLLP